MQPAGHVPTYGSDVGGGSSTGAAMMMAGSPGVEKQGPGGAALQAWAAAGGRPIAEGGTNILWSEFGSSSSSSG